MPAAALRYPADALDDRKGLLDLLGSFWASLFAQGDLVADILHARARREKQAALDLAEAEACIGRATAPVRHRERWVSLILRESERNTAAVAPLRYGDNAAYGGGFRYGQARDDHFVFPLRVPIHSAAALSDRLSDAQVVLIPGLDFRCEDGRMIFREDPFSVFAESTRSVGAGDNADRELVLWAFDAEIDRDYVHAHWGYPFGFHLPSSPQALRFLNALWDAVVEGTSRRALEQAIGYACDIPLAQGEETVQTVTLRAPDALFIATDRNVYRFQPTATPRVEAGQRLVPGEELTDALVFLDFARGEVPAVADLPALALGPDFLGASCFGDLVFENRSLPVTTTTDGAFTRAQFPLAGRPEDVEWFWDTVHQRGVAAGRTLAQALDLRESPAGEPSAASLPARLNPLAFLVENVFRGKLLVVRLRRSKLGSQRLPDTVFRILRPLLSPYIAVMFLHELEASPCADRHTVDLADGELGRATQPATLEISGTTVDLDSVVAMSTWTCL